MSKNNQINKKKEQMGKKQQKKQKYKIETLTQQKTNTVNQTRKIYIETHLEPIVLEPSPKEDLEKK